jgi:hypothetical protein
MMRPIEIRATKEKETPGTWRFKADEPNSPIRFVYVRKDAFAGGDVPQKIVVTIEAQSPAVTARSRRVRRTPPAELSQR